MRWLSDSTAMTRVVTLLATYMLRTVVDNMNSAVAACLWIGSFWRWIGIRMKNGTRIMIIVDTVRSCCAGGAVNGEPKPMV